MATTTPQTESTTGTGKIRQNRLKALRLRSRLTQKEVGKILDMDFSTVSKHESGTRSLSPKEIEAYSKLYKVSSYEIFLEPEASPTQPDPTPEWDDATPAQTGDIPVSTNTGK